VADGMAVRFCQQCAVLHPVLGERQGAATLGAIERQQRGQPASCLIRCAAAEFHKRWRSCRQGLKRHNELRKERVRLSRSALAWKCGLPGPWHKILGFAAVQEADKAAGSNAQALATALRCTRPGSAPGHVGCQARQAAWPALQLLQSAYRWRQGRCQSPDRLQTALHLRHLLHPAHCCRQQRPLQSLLDCWRQVRATLQQQAAPLPCAWLCGPSHQPSNHVSHSLHQPAAQAGVCL
jgi:hypothetical protein